jgi:hypothetical protein
LKLEHVVDEDREVGLARRADAEDLQIRPQARGHRLGEPQIQLLQRVQDPIQLASRRITVTHCWIRGDG